MAAEMMLPKRAKSILFNNFKEINITSVKKLLRRPDIDIDKLFYVGNFPSSITFLFAAVQSKDYELIDYLISKNPNVNIVCDKGTVLFAAIYDLKLIKKLHELGADIHARDLDGNSLLIWALHLNKPDVAEYLIKHGINLNTIDSIFKHHSLILACRDPRNENIVEMMLDNNADVLVSSRGRTSLQVAVLRGNTRIAKLLISRGADINFIDDRGFSILHATLECRQGKEILPYLLSLDEPMTDINIITGEGLTLLHWYSYYGHIETNMYSHILDAGIDVNVENMEGQLIVEFKHADIPEILIIKRHIVKLISAGLTVCERNRRAVESIFKEQNKVCLEELEKMKVNRVGASNISYFQVLLINEHYLSIRLKFADLDNFIDKENLSTEYQLYGGMLFYKLSKINRRIKYIKKLETFEGTLCELGLPYIFVRQLWYYFTNIEMKKLISDISNNINFVSKFLQPHSAGESYCEETTAKSVLKKN